jgi:hypothetical protein
MAAIDAVSAPFTPDASADFSDPPGHVPTGRVIIFWRFFQRVLSPCDRAPLFTPAPNTRTIAAWGKTREF